MKKIDPHIFGASFVQRLLDEPVLKLGEHRYSRHDLVNVLGTGNFTAAARLGRVLKRLGITSPAQLNKLPPADLAAVVGIGVTSLYVAMCLLDAEGYSIDRWYGWNEDDGVTFTTLKQRVFRLGTRRKHVA